LTYISNAEGYVTASQTPGPFTNNINCALNQIATADSYLRAQYLPAFEQQPGDGPAGRRQPQSGRRDRRAAGQLVHGAQHDATQAMRLTRPGR
jgi:hypothetical protein